MEPSKKSKQKQKRKAKKRAERKGSKLMQEGTREGTEESLMQEGAVLKVQQDSVLQQGLGEGIKLMQEGGKGKQKVEGIKPMQEEGAEESLLKVLQDAGLQQGLKQKVEEKGLGREEKGKAKRKVRHPADLPPSDLQLDTFQLKHPFVELRRSSADLLEMDYDTLKEFVTELAPSVHGHLEVYRCLGDEMGVRLLHMAILYFFGQLANTMAMLSEWDAKGEDREGTRIRVRAASKEAPDENEDDDEEAASKASSREGAVLAHEAASSRGRADFLVQAFDKTYIRKCHLPRLDLEALCTFLVVESKGSDFIADWQNGVGAAVLQVASYCIVEARKNFEKGRKKPIGFQGWSMSHWAYGELHVDAVVKVIDGTVFRMAKDGPLEEDAALQAILSSRREKLRRHLCDMHGEYPDGDYVVGTVYSSKEVLQFLTPSSLEQPNQDVCRLVQGLLQHFLGRKVLKWKAEDANRLIGAMKAGEAEVKCKAFRLMGRDTYESFPLAKRLRV